jgi:anti-sigma28 factor (negative regulator of flagellin synthesis)
MLVRGLSVGGVKLGFGVNRSRTRPKIFVATPRARNDGGKAEGPMGWAKWALGMLGTQSAIGQEKDERLGDVALVRPSSHGTSPRSEAPEGVDGRRPTMNRLDFSKSDSGVFCLEPKAAKKKTTRRMARPVETQVNENEQDVMKTLREMPEDRLRRIMKIRDEIAKGTYETADKWRVAMDRLINEARKS